MTSPGPLPDTSEPVPESKRSALSVGCGVFLVVCVALIIWGNIRDSDSQSNPKVDLTGSLTLWRDTSTRPEFSEACSGTGEYGFVEGDARIKIISGGDIKYEGRLLSGRGGESQECEFPFGGTLSVADEYTVELTADGESVSTTCRSGQVPVYERESIGDIAFMHLRITEDGFSCATAKV